MGLHLTCKEVAFAYPHSPFLFEHVTVEAASGEKLAVVVQSSTPKSTLAFVLAVRYNNVDLRDVTIDYVNGARGLVLDSQPTLFEGTPAENVTLGRASIGSEDLQWAIRFIELKDEIDRMPHGLETRLEAGDTGTTKSRAFVFCRFSSEDSAQKMNPGRRSSSRTIRRIGEFLDRRVLVR